MSSRPLHLAILIVLLSALTWALASEAGTILFPDRASLDGFRIAGFNTAIYTPISALPAERDPSGTSGTSGNLTIQFIDVGQGDSALITYRGRSLLVDGGSRGAGETVAAHIRDAGIERLDMVVATHPHEDHIGGLIPILEEFDVGTVVDSGRVHTSKTYEKFLTIIEEKGTRYRAPERGERIDLAPGLDIEVLSPPARGVGEDLNENSLVLKVTCGQVSFLLAGDAEKGAEGSMLSSGLDLDADLLKVGHHGSSTSSNREFIEAVSPEASVISVGARNSYGHPSPDVLKRLEAAGSAVYRTDLDGDVSATTDGTSLFVTCDRIQGGRIQGAIPVVATPAGA